eukprot:TRINITY_DN6537_c0_g1_i1.p1 TRINITY_DN6537_c0_g1~~TRINITY_DN6537_c0_g1_i1.p1  ORF type:complete len:426 (-),score=106.93 TRINITY_DN6537_c0_g1_i1:157-1401(-)
MSEKRSHDDAVSTDTTSGNGSTEEPTKQRRSRSNSDAKITRLSPTKLTSLKAVERPQKKANTPVRVWVDGCFDMMHFGHANALRQAKALGDYLIVGIHSDEEIAEHKGPPVMTLEERCKAVLACKWVDEVVPAAPFVTSLDILEQFDVTFCVHGDDLVCTADGEDTYAAIKEAGKFRTVPRTCGVSTTALVGRMLLLTKDHFTKQNTIPVPHEQVLSMSEGHSPQVSPYTGVKNFIPTSRRIVQFSEGRDPQPNDKVVYIDGAFDLFHSGHVEILRAARDKGDFLVVGVHDDQTINKHKGANYPLMNLQERVLSVLSCRHVDEVIIGAPYTVTKEILESMDIKLVVHGSDAVASSADGDPYKIPKERGIYETIKSPSNLTTTMIVERILKNRSDFEKRNARKQKKELNEMSAPA